MTKNDYYYLNSDHSVSPCSLEEWANQLEHMHRQDTKHVDEDLIEGKLISTVWLGFNHNYFGKKPHIFETMIFDENVNDIYMRRYSSWEDAEKGHKLAVQWVLDGCKDDLDNK